MAFANKYLFGITHLDSITQMDSLTSSLFQLVIRRFVFNY